MKENLQKLQEFHTLFQQGIITQQEYEAKKMEAHALTKLLQQGYQMTAKNGFFQSKSSAQQNFNSQMNIIAGDSASYQQAGSMSVVGNINLENMLENEILAIYDPSGKRITPEIFQMQVEFLAKELYLEYGIDKQLEEEYKIQECKELAQSFDAIMKAAEAEYLKNNPQ